jgi:hypothetical protein
MHALFQGTLHFVQITFNVTPEKQSFSVSTPDMNTIVQYATKAAVPISLYADQYGESALAVSPAILPYTMNLNSRSCSGSQVHQCVTDIAGKLPKRSAIAIILPPQIDDSSNSRTQGTGGYHGSVNGVSFLSAYIAANYNPAAGALTVQDVSFDIMGALSHEMAEMTVNPTGGNPEVCDACGPNYNSTYLAYFDNNGDYIQTTQVPPYDAKFPFAFYINAIVDPAHAKPATAPAGACTYAPIKISESLLEQLPGAIRCDAFSSPDDHFAHVIVAINNGDFRHIAYSAAKGKTVATLGNIPGLIDVAGFYSSDDKYRHALTLAPNGDISELFFNAN